VAMKGGAILFRFHNARRYLESGLFARRRAQ
jgi:hypothetical protein